MEERKLRYGFVYRWYDSYRNMFYIGCHFGYEDDGYICSSNRMRDAYRRKPNDFSREILITNIKSRPETLEKEFEYLQQIPDEELGKKYYNLHNHHFGHWSTDEIKSKEIKPKLIGNKGKILGPRSQETKDKISKSNKGKKRKYSKESMESLIKSRKGRIPPNKGKKSDKPAWNKGLKLGPRSSELIEKIALANIGKHSKKRTEEQKLYISIKTKEAMIKPEIREKFLIANKNKTKKD